MMMLPSNFSVAASVSTLVLTRLKLSTACDSRIAHRTFHTMFPQSVKVFGLVLVTVSCFPPSTNYRCSALSRRQSECTSFIFSTIRALLLRDSHESSGSPPFLLTLWSSVLLERLTGSQLFRNFLRFIEIRKFITSFTRARHLSLSLSQINPVHVPHTSLPEDPF